MNRRMMMSALLAPACAVALVGAAATAGDKAPGAGDPAPSFTLAGSDGKTYVLDEFKGKQAVVIAWFPKAFTSG